LAPARPLEAGGDGGRGGDRAPRAGEGDRGLDGADVPDVHALPPGRAAGFGPGDPGIGPPSLWPSRAPKGGDADGAGRAVASLADDRVLVPLARSGGVREGEG